jgi:purine-binding chemotaxis protein CheW
MMAPYRIFVRFRLDDLEVGLALVNVERVVRAVAVAPLPGAPAAIMGMVDVHGEVVPVASLRERFGLPPRDPHPEDHLVLARTVRRRIALAVDAAGGVVHCEPGDVLESAAVIPGLEHVHGVARTSDGLLLVHDLERFLALDEEAALQEALDRA